MVGQARNVLRIDFWGLKKPVLYLQACLWTGLGCNDRLLECCADVDTATIYEGEADPFDLPVMDHKNLKVTPPDLRKKRQVYLFEELLKNKSFYRVTETGWKWLWASICSKHYFKNPVISATFKTDSSNSPEQPYILEEGLSNINQGLDLITQGLAMKRAH